MAHLANTLGMLVDMSVGAFLVAETTGGETNPEMRIGPSPLRPTIGRNSKKNVALK